MNLKSIFLPTLMVAALLAGCQKQTATQAAASETTASSQQTAAANVDAMLANPQVGDVFAAKLSSFSTIGFEDQTVSYGLMKVVAVEGDKIIVITENAAWDEPAGMLDDLRNNLDTIEWDEEERIPLPRSILPELKTKGDIFDGRR